MKRFAGDALVIAVLAAAAGAMSWYASGRLNTALEVRGPSDGGYDDIWFDADSRDVYRKLTWQNFEQNQTLRHPLISIMARLPVRLYRRAVPAADPVDLFRGLLAATAAAWASLMFVTLRLLRCRKADALLLTLVGIVSAAALFTLATEPVFALGSVTILCAIAAVAWAERGAAAEWLTTIAGALTLSVTITNGMVGGFAAAAMHPARRVAQIVANAVCIVLVLWAVQRLIYPSSSFPWGYDRSYRAFILASEMRTPIGPLNSFWFHTMVMPEVTTIHRTSQQDYAVLSVQGARPGSATRAGMAATAAWAMLLAIGAWSMITRASQSLRLFLLASIAGQLLLHLVFGEETFLYAMHFLPLLVTIAALGTRTARPLVLGLGAVVIAGCLANNSHQFERALALAGAIASRLGP